MHLFQLDFLVSEEDSDLAQALLATFSKNGFEEVFFPTGDICLRVYSAEREALETLGNQIKATLPDIHMEYTEKDVDDWLESWRKNFLPVLCGTKFVVLPPWLAEKKTAFSDRIPLLIEPKNAFGTGQHETTALCLTCLSDLLDADALPETPRFLDLGTGSGILAVAAACTGMHGIGLDIDEQAIENARDNALLNGVEKKCTFHQGSLEEVHGETFDLIFANILADPLKSMAKPLAEALTPQGVLILSGLLTLQAEAVQEAYARVGRTVKRQVEKGEWAALVL